jgi:methyl-accepting chemotaxis protein
VTAVQHALKGVQQLHRQGVACSLALDELDKALLADVALAAAIELIVTSGEAAGDAANEFRAASRILTDRNDAEGHGIAVEVSEGANAAHEIRRELEAVRKRIEEINRVIQAMKHRVTESAGRVQALKDRGQQYAHRIAQ